MARDEFSSFEEFWPYYVRQHSKKSTRVVHFVGTTAAMACLAGGLLTRRRWLLAVAPMVGYGPAWASHFFLEKNKPATFTYPVWSLRGDLKMWWLMVRREMDAEVERICAPSDLDPAFTSDEACPPSGPRTPTSQPFH